MAGERRNYYLLCILDVYSRKIVDWLFQASIEAFHSILEREVIERNEFASYFEAKDTRTRFSNNYNTERQHRSIGFVIPQQK